MPPRSLNEIEWSESLLPPPPPEPLPADSVARAEGIWGFVPDWLPSLHWCPWMVEATLDGIAVRPAHIEPDLVALLRLVVAQDNSCRFCYGSSRQFLRLLGYSEAFVRRLEQDLLAADLDRRDRAALDHARLLSRANPRPGAAQADALAALGLGAAAVAEVAAFAALWVMETRITTLLAFPLQEGKADGLFARLRRPRMARAMRQGMRQTPLATPDPARRIAAFDATIAALGELPAAASLRKILDAAYGGGPLPRRTRLVVSAVIARALGCDATVQMFAGLLADDGLDPAALAAMLAHLDAGWLDERERMLVRAARDTVHIHQPALVQRRMLELRDRLSPGELVDFVGVAATTNALARLGALQGRC